MMYDENEQTLIYLSQLDFMTPTRFARLVQTFNPIKSILTASPSKLFELKNSFKDKFELLLNAVTSKNASNYIQELNNKHILCTTIISQNYPQKLKRLKNPPYVLYYTGDISLVNYPCIAMVGTRSPSQYGKLITKKYGEELAKAGAVIVSGMARGIDACSHEGALNANGHTIAVMGGGFDNIYPKDNLAMARQIAKKGLVITEYAPHIKPTAYTFPARNRIIAGLCDAVIITEAAHGSGSLYTKDYADEIGIDTFCVPGQINSDTSSATNYLIQSGSARSTVTPQDVVSALNITNNFKMVKQQETNNFSVKYNTQIQNKQSSVIKNNQKNIFNKEIDYSKLTAEQIKIVDAIKNGYCDYEQILANCNLSAQKLNINLTMLQISGIIKKLAGNAYCLS